MIRDGKRNEKMTEMETSKDRKTLSCKPIGYIYSPYKGKADTPKNGNERPDTEGAGAAQNRRGFVQSTERPHR